MNLDLTGNHILVSKIFAASFIWMGAPFFSTLSLVWLSILMLITVWYGVVILAFTTMETESLVSRIGNPDPHMKEMKSISEMDSDSIVFDIVVSCAVIFALFSAGHYIFTGLYTVITMTLYVLYIQVYNKFKLIVDIHNKNCYNKDSKTQEAQ